MTQDKLIDGKYEYFAFISYKEEDAEWAKWLHRELEHYKLPTAIRKEKPELPERISPIYEYKSEAGGGRLKEVIWKGLTSSKFLIVICSPRATKSKWLNDGIRYFVDSGQEENIIPFIIEGKPKAANPEEECFPDELLKLTGERELRGININDMGRDAEAVRVVSRMFDLKFNTLWQRYKREQQKRKNWIIAGIIVSFLCISGIAFWMYWQNKQTKRSNWKMMENQARAISAKAMDMIDDQDYISAQYLAIQALPDNVDNMNRPFVIEAEIALRNALYKNGVVLRGHSSSLSSVSYSHDGNKVISASSDNTLRIWDIHTGKCMQILQGHHASVLSGVFSPNDSLIASCSEDKTIRIWNASTGECVKIIKGHKESVNSVAFDPDGYRIASASTDGTIRIWNIATGACVNTFEGHLASVSSVAFSSYGGFLVSASWDTSVRLWNPNTVKCYELLKADYFAYDAAFANDNPLIACASENKNIYIWDFLTMERTFTLCGHTGPVYSICFSPDDKQLVSASADQTVRVWNLSNGNCEKILKGHTMGVYSVCFSPNGKQIASASWDNTIRIWELDSVNYSKTYNVGNDLVQFASEKDNSNVVFVSNEFRIYDYEDTPYIMVFEIEEKPNFSVFSSDKKIIATASANKLSIRDASNGKIIKSYNNNSNITCAGFSPSNKMLAFASEDNIIRTLDVFSGDILEMKGQHRDAINNVSFSPDGGLIVSSSNDETIRIWDAHTAVCKRIIDECHSPIEKVQFSPDGSLIVSANVFESTIRLWDSKTGECIHIMYGHANYVLDCGFSPNGKYLVSSSYDNTIRVWDVTTGQCVKILNGHKGGVYYVTFSSDGNHILSASYDKTFRIWDFPPLQKLIDETRERFKDRKLTPEERRKYYLE